MIWKYLFSLIRTTALTRKSKTEIEEILKQKKHIKRDTETDRQRDIETQRQTERQTGTD